MLFQDFDGLPLDFWEDDGADDAADERDHNYKNRWNNLRYNQVFILAAPAAWLESLAFYNIASFFLRAMNTKLCTSFTGK